VPKLLPDTSKRPEWCDEPSCQKRKRDLEAGRIIDTGKRGPHNATGDLEFTSIIIGRPDLSYDNTVWAFASPGKRKSNGELKKAAMAA
jgi:hypothetical protein